MSRTRHHRDAISPRRYSMLDLDPILQRYRERAARRDLEAGLREYDHEADGLPLSFEVAWLPKRGRRVDGVSRVMRRAVRRARVLGYEPLGPDFMRNAAEQYVLMHRGHAFPLGRLQRSVVVQRIASAAEQCTNPNCACKGSHG